MRSRKRVRQARLGHPGHTHRPNLVGPLGQIDPAVSTATAHIIKRRTRARLRIAYSAPASEPSAVPITSPAPFGISARNSVSRLLAIFGRAKPSGGFSTGLRNAYRPRSHGDRPPEAGSPRASSRCCRQVSRSVGIPPLPISSTTRLLRPVQLYGIAAPESLRLLG